MQSRDIPAVVQLDLYSHGIKVSKFDVRIKQLLLVFCRSLAQYGYVPIQGRRIYKMIKVYASATRARTEFRFHRNQEEDLISFLVNHGVHRSAIRIIEHPLYEPQKVVFKLNPNDKRKPRPHQIPIIDFFASPGKIKVVTLQTGGGKSICCLMGLEKIGQRAMMVIKSMYVDKWIDDIHEAYDIKPGELMIVRGSKALKALIELGLTDELEAKFIICTNTTLFNYFKSYEVSNGVDPEYQVPPEKLYETLKVGVRIIDEVHLDFHLNFRQDLYAHVPKTISMSATLDSDNRFLNKMYNINFPAGSHAPQPEHDKYICVRELQYGAYAPHKLRHLRMKQYSHTLYEKSILKQPKVLEHYLAMIAEIVRKDYLAIREPGQKMVVFCSLKKMCELVCRHLAKVFKDEVPEVVVKRYVDEDPYENLLESDISVTTIQSAGTAVDIPGLRVCLMTTALSSKQTNEQVVGRLRRLKDWPDVTPHFLFLTNRDIPKHVKYGAEKQKKLDGKVLSFNTYQTPFKI